MTADQAEGVGAGIEVMAHIGEVVGEAQGSERFNLSAITAALIQGSVALLMLGVQPLVLGALLSDHRITVPQLTWAATVEMLGLGVVAGVLAATAPHRRLRGLGLAAMLVLALANGASLYSSGTGVILCRAVVGAAGGVTLWIVTGMIARSEAAVRISAIFLGAQSVSQAALAAALPFMARSFGANAGFVGMTVLAVIVLPLVALIPDALSPLPKAAPTGRGPLSFRGVTGLSATFLIMAGVVGLWVFVEPLAKMDGVSEKGAAFAVAASLAAQILGSVAIAIVGPRLPAVPSLVAMCLANLLVIGLIGAFHGAAVFVPATLLFGFLWNAEMPLFFPLLLRADPTRRVAMLSSGAELLGSAAGPVLTGALATDADVRPVLAISALLFCAALLCVVLAGLRPKTIRGST